MKKAEFENMMRDSIVNAYIKVMGVEKWNGLTNEEKDAVLHLVLVGFAKGMGV